MVSQYPSAGWESPRLARDLDRRGIPELRIRASSLRAAFTLLELLVVIAIIGVVMGILLPAIQRVREAAARAACQNNLKQAALSLQQYHGDYSCLPPGFRSLSNSPWPWSGWTLSALPYVEQAALYKQSLAAYAANWFPFANPPHVGLSTPLKVFACPSDSRVPGPGLSQRTRVLAAFTSYLGVSGLNYATMDGVLFPDSQVRFTDISDGTSYTLMLGERPPSADLQFGWWYAGIGQRTTGSADLILGVRDENLQQVLPGSLCGPGAYPFSPGGFNDPCGMFHFWSPHPGGANFAFADGSVRLVRYSAAPLMPALASRAGGEVVTSLD